jgi:hypothetical protein
MKTKPVSANELTQSTVASVTAADKAAAAELLKLAKGAEKAADTLETKKMGFWAEAAVRMVVQGCTKDGIETAEPDLKTFGAWRSACSVIKGAREFKVAILGTDGLPRLKGDVFKDTKAAKKLADGGEITQAAHDPVTVDATNGNGVKPASHADVVHMALTYLREDKALRDEFRVALKDIVRMDTAKPAKPAEQAAPVEQEKIAA